MRRAHSLSPSTKQFRLLTVVLAAELADHGHAVYVIAPELGLAINEVRQLMDCGADQGFTWVDIGDGSLHILADTTAVYCALLPNDEAARLEAEYAS